MFGTWQQAYGPFLRFQDYAPISSDQALWLGSVLYVCHSSVSALGELGLTVIDQGVQLHVRVGKYEQLLIFVLSEDLYHYRS